MSRKFFNSHIGGICKYVDIRDDKEIMEGVKKTSELGQTIFDKGIDEGIEKTLRILLSTGAISNSDAEKIRKAAKESH